MIIVEAEVMLSNRIINHLEYFFEVLPISKVFIAWYLLLDEVAVIWQELALTEECSLLGTFSLMKLLWSDRSLLWQEYSLLGTFSLKLLWSDRSLLWLRRVHCLVPYPWWSCCDQTGYCFGWGVFIAWHLLLGEVAVIWERLALAEESSLLGTLSLMKLLWSDRILLWLRSVHCLAPSPWWSCCDLGGACFGWGVFIVLGTFSLMKLLWSDRSLLWLSPSTSFLPAELSLWSVGVLNCFSCLNAWAYWSSLSCKNTLRASRLMHSARRLIPCRAQL